MFEEQTKEFIKKMETLKHDMNATHKAEWELKKRKNEIWELQKANHDLNLALDYERKMNQEMRLKLNEMQMQANLDKVKVRNLLEMAEPIEKTMKMYYDQQELKPSREAKKKDLKSVSLANLANVTAKTVKRENFDFKEISLEEVESERVLHLKRQLGQLKRHFDDTVKKMNEDRRLREEEYRLFKLEKEKETESLLKRVHLLEERNRVLTKDFLDLKYSSQQAEREVHEQLEKQKKVNQDLMADLKDTGTQFNKYRKQANKDYVKKADKIATVMRGQVKKKDENLNIMKEQYKKISEIYNDRVKSLEGKLKEMLAKYKKLERKSRNALEGFINELRLIRERAKSFEVYIHKLKRLSYGDIDRREEIKDMLQAETEEDLRKFGVLS